jgi:hypothetical protein
MTQRDFPIDDAYFRSAERMCTAATNPLAAIQNLVQPQYSGAIIGWAPATTRAVNGAARCGRITMSSITADGIAAPAANPAGEPIGPLEQKHLQFANYRAVTDDTEVSKTHWHIATANALGWGFDGMDGVIFALVAPMVSRNSRSPYRNIAPACRLRCSSA